MRIEVVCKKSNPMQNANTPDTNDPSLFVRAKNHGEKLRLLLQWLGPA